MRLDDDDTCNVLFWTNPGSTNPQKFSCTATYLPFQKPSKWNEQDIGETAGEARTNT